MEHLIVKVADLKLGNEIAEDIFANTSFPLIRKDTRITREHFHVFRAFHITEVPVINRDPFNKEEAELEESSTEPKLNETPNLKLVAHDVANLYKSSVADYKKEFTNWQSGAKVDVSKIRQLVIPIVEKVLNHRQIVAMLNDLSSVRDYTHHHAIALGIIAGSLAKKLGYDHGQIMQIATAAALSDCGMSRITNRILEKSEALTQMEFNEIKKHTIYGYSMVKDSPLLRPEMKLAILQHHERLDGSGYPKGEKMEDISMVSQIIAVADIYHAMTSERIYRPKASPFKVLEMIREDEFGKFNIQVVQALISIVGDLPIGLRVELSSGETGEVIFNQQNVPTRPMIRLSNSGEILDLSKKRQLYIERILG
ncbi:HD-GYP domain-containing protein [Paenisporosarcina cavernae]|uniref:HD-GYP domain-containing protein n=1 Tax=Paenisporosarcina cavernae TaxID=2320858 RepID=A0A385YNY2_9BACL|nr:HD-GYP domain-containing protein [Paenisporosarcina cavernae]AYC28369.1 HD-GYP domain-containing protein [Paenisporosarcina cavernae]